MSKPRKYTPSRRNNQGRKPSRMRSHNRIRKSTLNHARKSIRRLKKKSAEKRKKNEDKSGDRFRLTFHLHSGLENAGMMEIMPVFYAMKITTGLCRA